MINIRYNKVRLNNANDLYVHPLGDLHIGHVNCNMDRVEQELEGIPYKENHRILLMGDMVDCGTKGSIGASPYEQSLSPNQQLNKLVKLFRPFKEQIDGVLIGNHEYRIMKESGIDIAEQFCNQLDIPYLMYSGVVTYSIGTGGRERAYDFNMIHGSAGGGVANALTKCKAMSNKVVADVYMMGHCHYNAYVSRVMKYVDSRNSKITDQLQYFVLTGHSLDYDDSYADQANLEISPMGFPIVVCSGSGPKQITVM